MFSRVVSGLNVNETKILSTLILWVELNEWTLEQLDLLILILFKQIHDQFYKVLHPSSQESTFL